MVVSKLIELFLKLLKCVVDLCVLADLISRLGFQLEEKRIDCWFRKFFWQMYLMESPKPKVFIAKIVSDCSSGCYGAYFKNSTLLRVMLRSIVRSQTNLLGTILLEFKKKKLLGTHNEEAIDLANYFEDTYISRWVQKGRKPPMFKIDLRVIWSRYVELLWWSYN